MGLCSWTALCVARSHLVLVHVPTASFTLLLYHRYASITSSAFVSRSYCVLGTLTSFALSSYCIIHMFYIPKLSNELLPSVYIWNFINLSAEREVCKPKCLSLSFFFFAQKGRLCIYNRSYVSGIVIRTWKSTHVDMLEHDII